MKNFLKKFQDFFSSLTSSKALNILLLIVIAGSFGSLVFAATPNPGHPWSEVGNGDFQVTGATAMRTYTFPNYDSTVVTGNSFAQGDLIYGSSASTTAQLAKNTSATRYVSNTGTSNNPAWAQIDLTNGVTGTLPTGNGGTGSAFFNVSGPTVSRTYAFPDVATTVLTDNADVTLAQGGTNASLTASNGGIFYSTASAGAILAGTATAGQALLSGASTAPTWSTATYPTTAGTSGNYLKSDGTNFTSTAPDSRLTLLSKPDLTTGAPVSSALSSLTAFDTGLFNVSQKITVNQLSYNIAAVTTAGTYKICVYNEAGTKYIDVTSGTNAAGTNSVTVGSVVLTPGNYYVAMGCATTCSNTVSHWTSSSLVMINTTVPAGKEGYEGTVTMTSGTCNTTFPAFATKATSKTPLIRFDN